MVQQIRSGGRRSWSWGVTTKSHRLRPCSFQMKKIYGQDVQKQSGRAGVHGLEVVMN